MQRSRQGPCIRAPPVHPSLAGGTEWGPVGLGLPPLIVPPTQPFLEVEHLWAAPPPPRTLSPSALYLASGLQGPVQSRNPASLSDPHRDPENSWEERWGWREAVAGGGDPRPNARWQADSVAPRPPHLPVYPPPPPHISITSS